jgi:hypothetical protein
MKFFVEVRREPINDVGLIVLDCNRPSPMLKGELEVHVMPNNFPAIAHRAILGRVLKLGESYSEIRGNWFDHFLSRLN